MEALRLEGNALFSSDPGEAAERYLAAVALYERRDDDEREIDATCTLDEFTKSAGNALTCLFKVGRIDDCEAAAKRVLLINPILAKANAFYGRCLLTRVPLTTAVAGDALLYLCRAMYELPSLEPSARAFVSEAIQSLHLAREAAAEAVTGGDAQPDFAVRVIKGENGNGVRTEVAIPPGVSVSTTRQPFSVAPYEEVGENGCCVHCGTSPWEARGEAHSPTPLSCHTCGLVFYCSLACQQAHEAQHRDYECATLTKLKAMLASIETRRLDVPDDFYELAFHCVTTIAAWRAKRPGHEQVLQLEAHADEVAQSLHPTLPLLCELFGELDQKTIATVLGVIRCNALETADASGMGIGQALHCGGETITSYFNHACAPNCAIDAASHAICTTRFVEPGEELTIAYLPQLYYPTRLRQDVLREHFFFTCRCLRCEATGQDAFERAIEAELPGEEARITRRFHGAVEQLCTRIRSSPADVLSEEDVRATEKMLADVKTHLFSFHYLCHELRNTLSFLYAVLGRPRECLRCCLEELLMWESILPGALPVKQLKIQNALQCVDQLSVDERASLTEVALLPHLNALATLYGVE